MPSEPTILAFDTSAAYCAAALLSRGRVIEVHAEEMGRGQAERLMPMLEEMLQRAGLCWADLDAIGVGIGPGNFTGIRISVAAARGLALALDRPAIGVSGFDVAAFGAPRPVTAAIPAPRAQVYVQELGDTTSPPRLCPADALRDTDHETPPDAGECARRIALIAASRLGVPYPRPAPLYVRPADAAPPRDPAPVILP